MFGSLVTMSLAEGVRLPTRARRVFLGLIGVKGRDDSRRTPFLQSGIGAQGHTGCIGEEVRRRIVVSY